MWKTLEGGLPGPDDIVDFLLRSMIDTTKIFFDINIFYYFFYSYLLHKMAQDQKKSTLATELSEYGKTVLEMSDEEKLEITVQEAMKTLVAAVKLKMFMSKNVGLN